MKLLDYMAENSYEQVVYCCDPGAGLKAIIAIHDTTLGPALGGCRIRRYSSEEEALTDALRLARAMTYKNSAAGLNLGGGKAVVMADPKEKTEALLRALGRFVQSLGGRYITTEDVGTSVRDMEFIRTETRHVTGLPLLAGGSGDPSPMTAFGVLQAMKACAKESLGSDSLKGRRVALQGVGKVGYYLAGHLQREGVITIAADVNPEAARRAEKEFGLTLVEPDAIYDTPCDIFSPCALGGIINNSTIPRLGCRVVAGGANNQLAQEGDADALAQRGILYAPDFIANAGGVINLSFELTGYNAEAARAKVAEIYHTTERVITMSKAENISTARAANRLAEARIDSVRRMKRIYLG